MARSVCLGHGFAVAFLLGYEIPAEFYPRSISETAAQLGISPRTVLRDQQSAAAKLRATHIRELEEIRRGILREIRERERFLRSAWPV